MEEESRMRGLSFRERAALSSDSTVTPFLIRGSVSS